MSFVKFSAGRLGRTSGRVRLRLAASVWTATTLLVMAPLCFADEAPSASTPLPLVYTPPGAAVEPQASVPARVGGRENTVVPSAPPSERLPELKSASSAPAVVRIAKQFQPPAVLRIRKRPEPLLAAPMPEESEVDELLRNIANAPGESASTAKARELIFDAIQILHQNEDGAGLVPPPAPGAEDTEAAPAAQTPRLNENEPIGQAPADADNRLLFLRTETVLLNPGDVAIDFGLRYVWREFDFPVVLPGPILADQRIRSRQLFVPMQLRYGAHENTQLFVNMPWGMSHFETANALADFETSQFGIGDVGAGVNYQVLPETDDSPSFVVTANFIAPTGDDPFAPTTIGLSNVSTLGSGFWGVGASTLFTKTYDPLVVFGGFGYLHRFDRSHLGFDFDPGELFTYQFGAGFAVNDSTVLSTIFLGAFETKTEADGIEISDSSQEPFTIRLALTHSRNRCCIVEPFVAFGLNSDAPNADFGVILTRRN